MSELELLAVITNATLKTKVLNSLFFYLFWGLYNIAENILMKIDNAVDAPTTVFILIYIHKELSLFKSQGTGIL